MRPALTLSLLATLALALPLAAGQTTDPTVNESDLNSTAPPPDDSYLNDTNSSSGPNATTPSDNSTADPTLSASDFDTSAPPADTSYLDDGSAGGTPPSAPSGASTGGANVPAPEVALALGVTALAALALRRR